MTVIPPALPLNDPGFYVTDRNDVYRVLRDDFPVYWCQSGEFWALTRYEDVLAVSKDPARFCNGHGMTMRGGELADVKGGEVMITMDDSEHLFQRKLVNRSFTPRDVETGTPRPRHRPVHLRRRRGRGAARLRGHDRGPPPSDRHR